MQPLEPPLKASHAQLSNASEETIEEARHYDTPEKNLRKAVLDRALCDYLQISLTDKATVRRAEQWIFHGRVCTNKHSPDYWPLTFLEICRDLDLDPERIRFFVKVGRERFKGLSKQGTRTTDAALESLSQLMATERQSFNLRLAEKCPA